MKVVKALRWVVDAVVSLGEIIWAGRQLAKVAREGKLPHVVDDTDPIPLSPRQPIKPIVVPLRRGQKK